MRAESVRPSPGSDSGRWLLDRRHFLDHAATGLGATALAWLLGGDQASARTREGHFRPRAKRAIHIFSPGGVSHVDTFDYKPELERLDGQKLEGKGVLDTFFGVPGVLRKSVFRFSQHGQCGAQVSELFPHLATCVDDICFLHAMVAKSPSHSPACFQMNTGFTASGFPSLGAWLSYGLGCETDNLPTFVVLPDPRGLVNGGSANWTNAFLPAEHQGTVFNASSTTPVANLTTPASVLPTARSASLKVLARMNQEDAAADPLDTALAARLRSYELAAQMQVSVPEAIDLNHETEATRRLYGVDHPVVGPSARNFLMARRLLERGVRFVQIYNGGALGSPRINWDGHEDVRENHSQQGLLLDQPCAALLKDLKARGMLDDTLVIWSSEFGRTPFSQANGSGLGRDHHQHVFTGWLAGGGVKPGFRWGASDDVGYRPVENAVTLYDFHATILHLLGLDHEKLNFYHNGIKRRLTDVHGKVVKEIVA